MKRADQRKGRRGLPTAFLTQRRTQVSVGKTDANLGLAIEARVNRVVQTPVAANQSFPNLYRCEIAGNDHNKINAPAATIRFTRTGTTPRQRNSTVLAFRARAPALHELNPQLHHGRAATAFVLGRLGYGNHVRMFLQVLAQGLAEDAHAAAVNDADAR